MKNKMQRVKLDPKNSIREGVYSDGRKHYIFKCANSLCFNEIKVGRAPSQLLRATGYCTSCHMKKRPYGIIFNRVKWNANRKKQEISLTYEEFLEFTKINECVYCESTVEWVKYAHHGNQALSYNLDRKDASIGYTKENCVVCCRICNWAKNSLFSHEEFLIIGKAIKKVLKNRKKEN